jgi:hypothetical protein
MRAAVALLSLVLGGPAWGAQCAAQSGAHTAALVELYTSQGCSSCPPADRWLSSLATKGGVPERLVPLALHVDYWDYIGWKDPYAKREFSLRQRKLTRLQRLALVYTPQVMLQGRDFRGWGTAAFDAAVLEVNGRAARARIGLAITSAGPRVLAVGVVAEVLDQAQLEDAGLYLATYENRLQTRVTAGENRGRTLRHDHVVLQWEGPAKFAGPRLDLDRALPLLPGASPADSGVVAFIQNRRTAEVLQALLLATCP